MKPFQAIGSIINEFATSISSRLSSPRPPRPCRRSQKHDFQILDVSFSGFRTPRLQPPGQGQGQVQEKVRCREAALQLNLALTLTIVHSTSDEYTYRQMNDADGHDDDHDDDDYDDYDEYDEYDEYLYSS